MIYIVGKKSNQTIIERTEITSPVDIDKYKSSLAINYGGSASDYSVLLFEAGGERDTRMKNGDIIHPIWENNELINIDISSASSEQAE